MPHLHKIWKILILCILCRQIPAQTTLNFTHEDMVLVHLFQKQIDNSLLFIKNRQRSDGSYIYDYVPFANRQITTGVLVRQAGVMLGLAMAYDGQNEAVKQGIIKTMSYFRSRSTTYTLRDQNLRILADSHEAYTGAICLYLAGALWLEWKYPGQFLVRDQFHLDLLNTLNFYFNFRNGLPDLINTRETYVEKINRDAEVYATAQYFLVQTLFHLTFQRPHPHPALDELVSLYERDLTPFEVIHIYHWMTLIYYLQMEWNNPTMKQRILVMRDRHLAQFRARHQGKTLNSRNNTCSIAEAEAYDLLLKQKEGTLNRQELYHLTAHLRHLGNFQLSENSLRKTVDKSGKESILGITDPKLANGGFYHYIGEEMHSRIDFTRHCLSAYVTHKQIVDNIFMDKRTLNSYLRQQEILDAIAEMNRIEQEKPTKMHRVQIKEVKLY
ncbi:MAG: hypothetical protein H3C47_07710 [Candidatus Cloacimonetes bacterium]|nr:hypothetical protein [Candidatus Cloacimonadota bacterium]